MTKFIATAAIACAGAAVLLGQAGTAARSQAPATTVAEGVGGPRSASATASSLEPRSASATARSLEPRSASATARSLEPRSASATARSLERRPSGQAVPAADPKTYRAFVNKYCVGCHNSRNAQPPAEPVDLEKASLDDVLSSAATWERVLRKLSVRAMPPQNMPHPQETEYTAFTTWLAKSLEQAWAARGTSPGLYVVQRLNRKVYGNVGRVIVDNSMDVSF